MIKHIVMWKFQEEAEGKSKKENVEIITESLMKLSGVISEIKAMEIFADDSESEENYDAVLITEFENFHDLNNYKVHPEHQKISRYINKIKLSRASIDYHMPNKKL